jgi:hypothetical protein
MHLERKSVSVVFDSSHGILWAVRQGYVQSRSVSAHWGTRSLMQVCQQAGSVSMNCADTAVARIMQPRTVLGEVWKCMANGTSKFGKGIRRMYGVRVRIPTMTNKRPLQDLARSPLTPASIASRRTEANDKNREG